MNIHAIVAAASVDIPSTSVSGDGSDGNIPIGQAGKPDILAQANKEQVEKFFKTVDTKIAALNEELATVTDPVRKEELEMQMSILQKLKSDREKFADFKVSDDGKNVTFTIKDFVTAEKIKDLYFLEDGIFRRSLKEEYDAGVENGVFAKTEMFLGIIPVTVLDYEAAVLTVSKKYTVSSDMLKDASALDAYLEAEVRRQRELNN